MCHKGTEILEKSVGPAQLCASEDSRFCFQNNLVTFVEYGFFCPLLHGEIRRPAECKAPPS